MSSVKITNDGCVRVITIDRPQRRNGIRFHTGRVHARTAMEPILRLVRTGRFHPELVTADTAGWDDAPEAVAAHRSKLVIHREETASS